MSLEARDHAGTARPRPLVQPASETGARLVAAAQAMRPTLRERAAETAALRRIPEATVRELRDADLLKAVRPARYGGYELGLDEMAMLIAELARGCTSTAWVFAIFCDHAITLAMFPPEAQDEVWGADPEAVVCSGLAPSGTVARVDGGFRVSGRWRFSSGCDHSKWIFVNSAMPPESAGGDPTPTYFLLPRSDWTIDDTWYVSGLVGTGSKDVVIEDAFVPAHRVLDVAESNAGHPPGAARHGLVFQMPRVATVPYSLVAPAVGTLDALVEAFIERTTPGRSSRGLRLADQTLIQLRLAEAAAERDCARLLMERATRETMAAMREAGGLPLEQRARNRRDMAYITQLCVRAADRLYSVTGASGLFDGNEIRRMYLDIRAVGAHHANSFDIAGPMYGRVAFGLDAGYPGI